MNTPKTSATKTDVISLYLYGDTTENIGKKCGTSVGYVSGVITKLKEELGQKEVSAIREFAVSMRKSGISVVQALIGAKIYSIISKSGLDEDKLKDLILEVVKESQNLGISLSKLVESSKIISDLQEKADISLEDLPTKCQSMLENKDMLEEKLSYLTQQIANAKTTAKETLEKKDLTLKKIEEFDRVKTELEKYNIKINDLQKLVTILKKASDKNYDSDRIINQLQKQESYENKIDQLEQQKKQLHKDLDNETKKLDVIIKEIEEKKSLVTVIKNLEKAGIGEQDLQNLYKMVIDISKNNNINSKLALQRFSDEIKNNYDKMLGLKISLEKLEEKISVKSKELETTQLKEKEFRIKYENNLETLHILKRLQQYGIGHSKILEWEKLFESSKLDVVEFSKKMRKASDLEKIINTLEENLILQQKQINKLESRKKVLEQKIDELETRWDQVDQILKNSLDGFLSDAQEKIRAASIHATNAIEENGKKTRENLEKNHKEASNSQRRLVAEMDEFYSKSLKESKNIGNLEWILDFREFLLGISFVPSRDIPMIIWILERSLYYIKTFNSDTAPIESLIKKLVDYLENIKPK